MKRKRPPSGANSGRSDACWSLKPAEPEFRPPSSGRTKQIRSRARQHSNRRQEPALLSLHRNREALAAPSDRHTQGGRIVGTSQSCYAGRPDMGLQTAEFADPLQKENRANESQRVPPGPWSSSLGQSPPRPTKSREKTMQRFPEVPSESRISPAGSPSHRNKQAKDELDEGRNYSEGSGIEGHRDI